MQYAIGFYDAGTDWEEIAPCGNRDLKCAGKAFVQFAGPRNTIEQFYCDNAPELMAAAEQLSWVNPTSTPFLSKTNGKIERRLQQYENGIKCALKSSGMPHGMWGHAGKHYCTARCLEVRNGDSAYNRRHRKGHCKAKLAAFGQLVSSFLLHR
jgi:hypothetical protein